MTLPTRSSTPGVLVNPILAPSGPAHLPPDAAVVAVAPPPAPSEPARPGGRYPWAWVLVAATLLVGAGVLRRYQGRLVHETMSKGGVAPFDLASLPSRLGPWTQIDSRPLEPGLEKASGSTSSVQRTYLDERTGVSITVLLLFGPPVFMQGHAPEICYPFNGWIQQDSPADKPLLYSESARATNPASPRSLVYTKGEGAGVTRRLVTYVWGYQGRWTAQLLGTKQFLRLPGMFKVHLDREWHPGEVFSDTDPSRDLMGRILSVLDAKLQASSPAPVAPTARAG